MDRGKVECLPPALASKLKDKTGAYPSGAPYMASQSKYAHKY